jgi:hypothetical protein
MDVQNWSGLTRLKAVLERLRPTLAVFRDIDGKELFDLPDAPRPSPDVPAPARFLGEYDNVLLGHADRRRIVPAGLQWQPGRNGSLVNNVLIDGMFRAVWWIERDGKRRATLVIRPLERLSASERDEAAREGRQLIEFAAADAGRRDVRFERLRARSL